MDRSEPHAGARPASTQTLPTPADPAITPDTVRAFRHRLKQPEDTIDPTTWAGSVPDARGTAPHIRIGHDRWFNLMWLIPLGFIGLVIAVAIAQGLREIPGVQDFIRRYPGTWFPPGSTANAGFPAFVGWQHFLNAFLMIFIIRSGVQILTDHPRLYWTRHSTPGKEWFRFQKPVPADPLWTAKQDSVNVPSWIGLPGLRHSIGLARWWHLGVDTLWLANGIVFMVLMFTTDHWIRLVPTSWDVFPNALSAAIQYASLNWPLEHGWFAYNSLQLLAYFITVFIAPPLALITGLGMSPALSTRMRWVSSRFSIQVARSLHFLVLCWFLLFIVVHLTLVFTTGALQNLNHMYADRNDTTWVGFWIFFVSLVVMIVGWVGASPLTLRKPRLIQRVGFALIGPAQRLFEHIDAKPGQYTKDDVSPYMWHNGKYPETDEYQKLFDDNFVDYRLHVGGLVDNPVELSLAQLRAMPYHEQTTQHYCIQGWSGVATWGGVSMSDMLALVQPKPNAKWAVFYSLGDGPDGGLYYDAHPIEQMRYPLTMLAYDMNGEPLSYGHGAPLRLRNEVQLGFKMVKWIRGIEFVEDFSELGGGFGGYNEDHEFFGYRQSI